MVLGHVKWFDNRKGFGFLRTEGVDEDIFIHYVRQADGVAAAAIGAAGELEEHP